MFIQAANGKTPCSSKQLYEEQANQTHLQVNAFQLSFSIVQFVKITSHEHRDILRKSHGFTAKCINHLRLKNKNSMIQLLDIRNKMVRSAVFR